METIFFIKTISFLNRTFLQCCALLLAIIITSGCGARSEPELAEVSTPTPTWMSVPTFTPTVAPLVMTPIVSAAAQATLQTDAAEADSSKANTESPAPKLIATTEGDAQIIGDDTQNDDTQNDDTQNEDGSVAEGLSILVPTATPAIAAVSDNTLSVLSGEPYVIVAAEIVNVRRGPGIGYELMGSVNREEQWPTIGRNQQGDWWQVCCFAGDQPGWLYGELIDVYGGETVTVTLDIPLLPTPLPPTPLPPTPEPVIPEISQDVALPAVPAVEDAPVPVETVPAIAVPPANNGTAGNFDPNAQFHIVHYRLIGYGENNGGIFNNGGQHIIFVNVVDENGQGIDGAVVKDALADDLQIVTGSKGPGRAEFEMFWEPYKLYVASIPAGAVTSQISNQMNTAKPHIPDVIGKLGPPEHEYAICPTPDDRCEPPFFHAHWSYEITFQKVK